MRLISTHSRDFFSVCASKQTAVVFSALIEIKPETKEWRLNASPDSHSDIFLYYFSHSVGQGLVNIADIRVKSAFYDE